MISSKSFSSPKVTLYVSSSKRENSNPFVLAFDVDEFIESLAVSVVDFVDDKGPSLSVLSQAINVETISKKQKVRDKIFIAIFILKTPFGNVVILFYHRYGVLSMDF